MKRFIVFLFAVFLISCGTRSERVVIIPSIQKGGVFHRKSKCSYTYSVGGKVYCVRKSSYGYVEVGYASWYGPGFHGKRTASGEIYNMYKLTAAHKTLPLGTYVKVINLENGKSVIVKINDRGPFVEGRIIDLSYAAAKKLGMLKKGVAKVKLIALGRKVDHRYVASEYRKGRFYVQIGAFRNKLNAYSFKYSVMRRYGIKVRVVYMDGYYRVLAGPVFSLKDAKQFKEKLKKKGIETSFIIRL
jgi:rare lipoprotein A